SSRPWIAATGIEGSKISTFGPKSGASEGGFALSELSWLRTSSLFKRVCEEDNETETRETTITVKKRCPATCIPTPSGDSNALVDCRSEHRHFGSPVMTES